MECRVSVLRKALVSTFLIAGSGTASLAQEQAETSPAASIFLETFDNGDPSAMLGGQIDLENPVESWVQHVTDGKLVLENRTSANSVYYNDIGYVKYPDSPALEPTENSVMTAMVEARNIGAGGVGIYFGNGEAGEYLAFVIDAQGQYHVLKKHRGKVERMHSGKAEAILVEKPNEVALAWRGASLALFANGTEVITVPYERTPGSGQGGLGLLTFGIGSYFYDSVTFSRSN
jgi:hypothetical protein